MNEASGENNNDKSDKKYKDIADNKQTDVNVPDSLQNSRDNFGDNNEKYISFCDEFKPDTFGRFTTTVKDTQGFTYTITLYPHHEEPTIAGINYSSDLPVQFSTSQITVQYMRSPSQLPTQPLENTSASNPDSIFLDFSDDQDEVFQSNPTSSHSTNGIEKLESKIINDLILKFRTLGLNESQIRSFTQKLIESSQDVKKSTALLYAKKILPLYRQMEVKRLLSDPTSPTSYYYEISTKRQKLYNQLNQLLRDAGMNPSQMTEFLMKGIFDQIRIAGIPVFTDSKGIRYLVIDYAFAGYDELQPEGTDFSREAAITRRDDISRVLSKAEELGYKTYFCNHNLSGGTHQRWNWHGIRIEDFDEIHVTNNTAKVMKILTDVGIHPLEAVNSENPYLYDLYIDELN